MAKIKELSLDERPREKLLQKGAGALSDAELIAILFRTGVKGASAVDVARAALERFGGLTGVFRASTDELKEMKGLDAAKTTALAAAIELARRYLKAAGPGGRTVSRPADIHALYHPVLAGRDREVFIALYCSSRNEILRDEELGSSTANACLCHPQEFVRGLIRSGASRLVLIHNHPSGDLSPSKQDISFTVELARHLSYFGFELLDHVIIASDGFTSMKESGHI